MPRSEMHQVDDEESIEEAIQRVFGRTVLYSRSDPETWDDDVIEGGTRTTDGGVIEWQVDRDGHAWMWEQ